MVIKNLVDCKSGAIWENKIEYNEDKEYGGKKRRILVSWEGQGWLWDKNPHSTFQSC